jgi:hypothetical protein
MKKFLLMAALLVSASSFAADSTDVANAQKLIITAEPYTQTSISTNSQMAFSKSFFVQVSNPTDKAIDLSKLCYIAQDAQGRSFKADLIASKDLVSSLAAGKMVKDVVAFTTKNRDVLSVDMVIASADCQ